MSRDDDRTEREVYEDDELRAWIRAVDALRLDEASSWSLVCERLRSLAEERRAGPRAAP